MVSGISLANKCQLLFGFAIAVILIGALSVPWIRTSTLVEESQWEVARKLADEVMTGRLLLGDENVSNNVTPLDDLLIEEDDKTFERILIVRVNQVDSDEKSDRFLRAAWQRFQKKPDQEEYKVATEILGKPVYRYARTVRESHYRVLREGLSALPSPGAVDPLAKDSIRSILLIDRTSQFAEGQLLTSRVFIIASWIAASLMAGVVFYLILTKLILSPVRHLRETTEKIQGGEWKVRSQIQTGDEFEQLSDAFNSMLDRLDHGQTQLRALNESLDLKLTELSEANLGLYESNRLKSEFVASVSHELRTPLNSIIGFAELLQEVAHSESNADPKRMRYLSNIVTSGRSLLEMINEMLDMAKIEAGRLEITIEPTSATDLIEGLVGIMRPQAEAKQITLRTVIGQRLPMIETDPGKLQQILYNFLSNAIKFTPVEGTVTISADRVTRQDNTQGIRMAVSDTGPGIPYDLQDVIFEKFRQVDAGHTREHPGTGLGLAICRELAQLLGATVSFVSEPGRGATFFVDLPLVHQPEAPQPLMA